MIEASKAICDCDDKRLKRTTVRRNRCFIVASDIKVNHARKAISATGLDKSLLQNFNFENVTIKADNAGEINYANSWSWKNVEIAANDKSAVSLKNSTGINL